MDNGHIPPRPGNAEIDSQDHGLELSLDEHRYVSGDAMDWEEHESDGKVLHLRWIGLLRKRRTVLGQ